MTKTEKFVEGRGGVTHKLGNLTEPFGKIEKVHKLLGNPEQFIMSTKRALHLTTSFAISIRSIPSSIRSSLQNKRSEMKERAILVPSVNTRTRKDPWAGQSSADPTASYRTDPVHTHTHTHTHAHAHAHTQAHINCTNRAAERSGSSA